MRTLLAAALALTLAAPAAATPLVGGPGTAPAVLAEKHIAVESDTLVDLAVQYSVGFLELVAANPEVDVWLPGAGTEVLLPVYHLLPDAPHEGIVVNVGDQRLYFFPGKGEPVETYPIGIGREGFDVPLGRTKITLKREKPTWVPPPSVRAEKPDLPEVVPPGPDNPLGDYALNLGWPLYRIHGTNRPYGVGRRVSHGCIRLYPADIEALFKRVSVGTPVTVVNQAVKVGWVDGELYLEVHPSGQELDELEAERQFTPRPLPEFEERILAAAGEQAHRLNWDVIIDAWERRTGLPTRITGTPEALADRRAATAEPSGHERPPAWAVPVPAAPLDLFGRAEPTAPSPALEPDRGIW